MNAERKFTKNILIVTISNIVRLIAGMAIGLVIPKFLSVTDYGYYKTYTLYMTYIGLFSIGLIDGIYLKYGGNEYESLDKGKFRCFTRVLLYLEAIITVILFLVSFMLFKGETKIIFISIAFNLIAQQFLTYFAQVSQLTSRFNTLSIFNIIWSIVTILGVGIIYFIPNANYAMYIMIVVITNYLLLLYYFFEFKEIIFGKANKIKEEKNEIIELMKLGIPLLIGNLVSMLVLSCDRIFVERLYDTNTYAVYSFAYSLFSIANTFITAISMVLYPMLKKIGNKDTKKMYESSMGLLLIIVFIGLAMYFPLDVFIKWYLPKYENSLVIFKIILPGLAMSSCISVVMQNYYKVANKNLSFFIKSLIVLIIAVVLNVVAIVLFKDIIYISIASVISLFIWYIITEYFFIKEYRVNITKNMLFLVISTILFYVCVFSLNVWIGFLIYVLIEGVLMLLLYKKIIFSMLNKLIKNKSKLK